MRYIYHPRAIEGLYMIVVNTATVNDSVHETLHNDFMGTKDIYVSDCGDTYLVSFF